MGTTITKIMYRTHVGADPLLNEIFEIEAVVVDSALQSPHNSFTNANDHYLVQVMMPVAGLVQEFESKFRIFAHSNLPHINEWRKNKYEFVITTLTKPRMDEAHKSIEYQPGECIFLGCKADLMIGDEAAIERILLVGINNPPNENIDWSTQNCSDYDW